MGLKTRQKETQLQFLEAGILASWQSSTLSHQFISGAKKWFDFHRLKVSHVRQFVRYTNLLDEYGRINLNCKYAVREGNSSFIFLQPRKFTGMYITLKGQQCCPFLIEFKFCCVCGRLELEPYASRINSIVFFIV